MDKGEEGCPGPTWGIVNYDGYRVQSGRKFQKFIFVPLESSCAYSDENLSMFTRPCAYALRNAKDLLSNTYTALRSRAQDGHQMYYGFGRRRSTKLH